MSASLSYFRLIITRRFFETIFITLLQYIGLMLSNAHYPAMPLAMAVGVSTAWLFLRGFRILPGIFLGSIAAYYTLGVSWLSCFVFALLYFLQNFLVLWGTHKLIGPLLPLDNPRDAIKFLLLFTAIAAVFTIPLSYFTINHWQILYWLKTLLVQLLGMLLITPLFLQLNSFIPGITQEYHHLYFPFALLVLGLLLMLMALFNIIPFTTTISREFLLWIQGFLLINVLLFHVARYLR